MDNKKRVFFLGAGFSKAINPEFPTLHELTIKVNKIFNSKKNSDKSLKEHYKTVPDTLKNNIEALLTYLYTDLPWSNAIEENKNEALYHKFVEIISYYISNIKPIDFSYSHFLLMQFMLMSNYCTIATLNYDDLYEKLKEWSKCKSEIITTKLKTSLSIIVEGCDTRKPYTSAKTPYILKECDANENNGLKYKFFINYTIYKALIQSISFSENKIDEFVNRLEYDMNIKREIKLILFGEKLEQKLAPPSSYVLGSGLMGSTIDHYYELVKLHGSMLVNKLGNSGHIGIIPPILDKSKFYKLPEIKKMWEQVNRSLKNAEEIYIIGFSFPPTDLSVRYLFQSALKNSKAKITVINTEKEAKLREHYDQVFGENNSNINYDYCGKPRALCQFIDEIVEPSLKKNITTKK